MSDILAEHIAVEQLSEWKFQSKRLAERMGNTLPIAYGGYTMSMAIHAASKTVPEGFHLYSAVGNYLGPASTTEKMTITVFPSRSTKTFQTRRVQVSQKIADGSMRLCMEVLTDFQRAEPELMNFSAPPRMKYSHWKDCLSIEGLKTHLLANGNIQPAHANLFDKMFNVSTRLFDNRFCPESIAGQTLMGVSKDVQTTQEHLPIASKTSAQWFRSRHPVNNESEQVAGLSFVLDGMIAFLPLVHNHMFLDDAGACSSLDFSLRIFTNNVNINDWLLREMVSHGAANGRSYSEARVWDKNGNLVASMTQQSILRPKNPNKL